MNSIPSKWAFGDTLDYPALPKKFCEGRIWVKVDGREYHSVYALNADEGWIGLYACDSDGKKLLQGNLERGFDVVRVRIEGEVEQGVR